MIECLRQIAEKVQQWAKQQGPEVLMQLEKQIRRYGGAAMKAMSAVRAQDNMKDNSTLSVQEQLEHKNLATQ
ncbi:unnamed protein product [Gongylonema pulchrum]|uniref:PspA/IM30 family protein n=1 Tax=Gongylonema pulchrum TaxID=637853 RepID=A0A183D440_9BILA|nr:unnamed protein product [Gongylonema pulchrum]